MSEVKTNVDRAGVDGGRLAAGHAAPSMATTPLVAHLNSAGCAHYSILEMPGWTRIALMLTPHGRGTFAEQFREILSDLQTVLSRQKCAITLTAQTIFLRGEGEIDECERLLATHFGASRPVTNFVIQAPCCGAAVAVEVWGIGGEAVSIQRYSPNTVAIDYDGVRRVYCSGISPKGRYSGVYEQTINGLGQLGEALREAGSDFKHVVRTWLYLGSITELENGVQRYQEMNRARADYYRGIDFRGGLPETKSAGVYPASTGIGVTGQSLLLSCIALESQRPDVFLVPLENPQQTPAYAYHPKYSTQSPKFSRAVCQVSGAYATTWISGTASIVNSESCHPGDIVAQTEQTIDNIQRLVSPENFLSHRMPGGGARLSDMAKIRVYVKRAQDLRKCRDVCESRFGRVPAIYAVADICRPELLVEIEGVAFSRFAGLARRG